MSKPGSVPPIDVAPEHWQVVRGILRAHVPGCAVWAFGSRVTGTAKPYSDLDLAIITTRPLGLEQIAALAEAFSESDLPWKVDLIDWATTSDRFRRVIERDKVVLQESVAADTSRFPSPARGSGAA